MNSKQTPWYWVPSLYFFQGIPYSVVMVTSGLIYTTMGISVSSFTFWTSLLYLPWTIKPLWSPFVDFASTKRNWVVKTQILLGIAFLLAGFSMPTSYFYPLSLLLLGLIALCSATHDIAADGFYMLALNTHQQSFFVGIRSTFYRVAMLTALGGLPLLAGFIQSSTGLEPKEFTVAALERQTDKYSLPEVLPQPDKASQPQIVLAATKPAIYLDTQVDSAVVLVSLSKSPDSDKPYTLQIAQTSGSKDLSLPKSQSLVLQFNAENWNTPQSVTIKADPNMRSAAQAVFTITAGNIAFSWLVALGSLGVLLLVFATFHQFVLPRPATEKTVQHYDTKAYFSVFVSFFKKKQVLASVLFFLFYRLGEAQLVKIATPFLVDSRANGGIGLSSAEYGFAYGTLGMISLTLGGILGGLGAARYGLKRLFWPMALAMNLPNLVYVYLAIVQPMPTDVGVYASISIEQFGYGFGFTAFMLYMLYYVGESEFKTAEYAIGTSLMALGMMLPGMLSGVLKEWLGYSNFFIYVCLCTIPGMFLIPFLKIRPEFGQKL